jgi:hypothetical protein
MNCTGVFQRKNAGYHPHEEDLIFAKDRGLDLEIIQLMKERQQIH